MALVATLVGFGFLTGRRAGDKEAADEDFCLVCLAMQQFARDDGQNTLTEGSSDGKHGHRIRRTA